MLTVRRTFLLLTCCALLAVAGAVRADVAASGYDEIRAGPPVGAKIPHDLATVDKDGQHRDFMGLARERGLLIMFNRSVDW